MTRGTFCLMYQIFECQRSDNERQRGSCPIFIIVPVYKEEVNIRPFLHRTEAVMEKMGSTCEIVFALDPSPDRAEEVIPEEINRNPNIKLLVFSRCFGQFAATMAGILTCTGETCGLAEVCFA
jgi:glycosyltransferase involved in cell wall biosynthesis